MRERHFPRVCRSCNGPMPRQEDTCWRCGIQWASEDGPRPALRVIAGGASAPVADARHAAAAVVGDGRLRV
jgi:predicted amidophosphoribosyltransferase